MPKLVSRFIQDGDEINLGGGVDEVVIPFPDHRLCNLRFAVAQVFVASGFADVVEKLEDNSDPAPSLYDEVTCRLLLSSVSS